MTKQEWDAWVRTNLPRLTDVRAEQYFDPTKVDPFGDNPNAGASQTRYLSNTLASLLPGTSVFMGTGSPDPLGYNQGGPGFGIDGGYIIRNGDWGAMYDAQGNLVKTYQHKPDSFMMNAMRVAMPALAIGAMGGAAFAPELVGGTAAAGTTGTAATGGIGGLVDGSTSLLGATSSIPASSFGTLTGNSLLTGGGLASGALGAGAGGAAGASALGSTAAAAAGGAMDWGSLLSNPQTWLGLGQVAGGVLGANAAGDAADAQIQASREAIAEQRRQYDLSRADLEPWRQAGVGALGQLTTGTQPGGDFNRNFRLSDFLADPGYQFRLTEGQNALENSAAARGGLLSGNTLKAITNYGQNAASQEFGNAYSRWNNDTSNRFNRLSGLAGTGQQATTNVAQMGQNTANSVGDLMTGAGNARASGYVGRTNAINNTLGGLQSMYTLNQLLRR